MSNQITPNKFASGYARTFSKSIEPDYPVTATFYLSQLPNEDRSEMLRQHPSQREYVQGDQLNASQANDEIGFELVLEFLEERNLTIVDKNEAQRFIAVEGTVATYSIAFQVEFHEFISPEGLPYLSYSGNLAIPENVSQYILHIGGLEKGLVKGTRSRLNPNQAETPHYDAAVGYSPQDISNYYDFPANDATGECIGLVELGGTYKMSDIEKYCQEFDLPVPNIIEVGTKPEVAANAQQLDDLEVTLDIEMVAGLAQNATIVIYYATSIPEAIHAAIYDTENNPSVLSISWAVSEYDCSIAERQMMEQMCYLASMKGITIVAASGDYGAYNKKSFLNVMLPASNPYVLGCGGIETYISKDYQQVWNMNAQEASGGGYSVIYPVPAYQQNAIAQYKRNFPYGNNGRGVPDVAANSAPNTAYAIVFNGQLSGMGAGTSASTPVWASLLLVMNKNLGYRLGWVNKQFYELESSNAFKSVLSGNNNYFPAAYGWNAATGLGAPNGKLLQDNLIHLGREYAYHAGEKLGEDTPAPKTTATKKAPAAKKKTPAPKKKAPAKKPTTRTKRTPKKGDGDSK